ncbi:MAG TPA: ribosome-associated translation inhibitor RaiA [candidate division Zixibacteria bacterium]|nr:ribosome-associated translation inhibitor RaiA [candidate division Zixibacteria bacterium]
MADVKVSVTFRHTAPTDALKRYVEAKVHRLGKFSDRPVEAHVVLSVDAKQRHFAEIELRSRGLTIHGREETDDLYSAIDLLMGKVGRQVQKHKEKIKLERRRNAQD